jgi:glutathionylspermidine synthase
MRAVVVDPTAGDDSAYRRFVQQAQRQGLLPDHLVRGEPYLARNAVVLTRQDTAQLIALTERFSRAFTRAGQALAGDVAAVEAIGFPWAAAELLSAEGVRTPLIGRFDFVQDLDGHWWLLELNADTPSGVREATTVDRLAWRSLGAPAGLRRPNAWLSRALVAAFRRALHDLPRGSWLGLVTDAGELEDLAQMAFTERLLREPLRRLGIEVVLGDVDDLRQSQRGVTLRGRRLAALYRYVPFETMFGTSAFAAIYDAVASGRLRVLNGLGGLLLQHKGLLAWLWGHADDRALPRPERAAIQEHLPPTWWIETVPHGMPRESLVAKQVFGREGEEVFFGEDLDTATWRQLAERRTYVAQQRVHVAEIDAVVQSSLGAELMRGSATIGCFAVDGRWAGYYTRLGGKIITSRAKWLATFEE